jgi:hypothetical protein
VKLLSEIVLLLDLGLKLLPLFEDLFEVSFSLPDLNLKVFDSLYKLLILSFLLSSPYVSLGSTLNVSEDTLKASLLQG